MNLKKIFAALLAVVLLMSCVPFAAAAAKEPTILYVGEKGMSDDNLIRKLNAKGRDKDVTVGPSEGSVFYYKLTYDKDIGYILTINNYTMSEMIESRSAFCGLYCDGDLTIRINGTATFDANDSSFRDAIGIDVAGTLTIEGSTGNATLNVNGDKNDDASDEGSIGIRAKTLMLDAVVVNACGGYAGIVADEALVTAASTLNANTTADMMKEDGKPAFSYSIVTKNFLQFGGVVTAKGSLDIDKSYLSEGRRIFDKEGEESSIYFEDYYAFAEESYSGYWSDSFKLFYDPSEIPSCIQPSASNNVAVFDGNKVILNRRGTTTISLTVQCGRKQFELDSRTLTCRIALWQWIPYILSGKWIPQRQK